MDAQAQISDWSLFDQTPEKSIAYPDGTQYDHKVRDDLIERCREIVESNPGCMDFRVTQDGTPYRVRCEITQSGRVFFLRKIQSEVSVLSPKMVPKAIIKQLTSPSLLQGGLVLIAGPPGVGKSTTATRTIVSRLSLFGGVAWSIEDPIEAHMEGIHGSRGGRCWQKEVAQGGFPQAMRDVMRCYPAKVPGMLMVGEVRDSETADECIRAATNGLLVIATIHATGIRQTIERMVSLTNDENPGLVRETLAGTLKLIVRQSKMPNRDQIAFQSLWIKSPGSAASAIADGNLNMLGNDLEFQANRIRMGEPVCQ